MRYDNVPARPKRKKKKTGNRDNKDEPHQRIRERNTLKNEVIEPLSISVWLRVRAIHGERA